MLFFRIKDICFKSTHIKSETMLHILVRIFHGFFIKIFMKKNFIFTIQDTNLLVRQ